MLSMLGAAELAPGAASRRRAHEGRGARRCRRAGPAHGRQARQPGRVLRRSRTPGAGRAGASSPSGSSCIPGRVVDARPARRSARSTAVELVTVGQRRGLGVARRRRGALTRSRSTSRRRPSSSAREDELLTEAVRARRADLGARARCRRVRRCSPRRARTAGPGQRRSTEDGVRFAAPERRVAPGPARSPATGRRGRRLGHRRVSEPSAARRRRRSSRSWRPSTPPSVGRRHRAHGQRSCGGSSATTPSATTSTTPRRSPTPSTTPWSSSCARSRSEHPELVGGELADQRSGSRPRRCSRPVRPRRADDEPRQRLHARGDPGLGRAPRAAARRGGGAERTRSPSSASRRSTACRLAHLRARPPRARRRPVATGRVGEDVTANVRTVGAIPHAAGPRPGARCPSVLEVRGEVYLPVAAFEELNRRQAAAGLRPFANPRNAAAGSLRQKDPARHRRPGARCVLLPGREVDGGRRACGERPVELRWTCCARAGLPGQPGDHGRRRTSRRCSRTAATWSSTATTSATRSTGSS